MSSINQKPQLRKHLDVTDVYQNKAVEQELDKQLDNLAQPTYQNTGAISQNKTSSSTKGCRLQMIKNNQEQEQEYRISINNNQVEEKYQSAFFQQFGFINANDQYNSIKKCNDKSTF